MADPVLVLDASGAGGAPVVRPPTPEEEAQRAADDAAAAARITYSGTRTSSANPTTTDEVPLEVFRITTSPQHVYRGTFRVTGIDRANGTTRDAEARMVFKRLAASLVQVGTTLVVANFQDTAAASWGIVPTVVGTDLVISVRGAAGRTVDWDCHGEVGSYSPGGIEV